MLSDYKVTIELNLYPGEKSYWDRTSLSMEMNEDLEISKLCDLFKSFLITLGFCPESVDKYFGEDEE